MFVNCYKSPFPDLTTIILKKIPKILDPNSLNCSQLLRYAAFPVRGLSPTMSKASPSSGPGEFGMDFPAGSASKC